MSEKILVTGFEPFGFRKKPNPSSEIVLPAVEAEYGPLVETLVLPVVHEIAGEKLKQAIADISPAAVVMFGVSAHGKVRLERTARNRRSTLVVSDNQNQRRVGKLDKAGPRILGSTLPLKDIYDGLRSNDVPVKFSNNAGTHLCNEIMYKGLAETARIKEETGHIIPAGFIHVGNGLSQQLTEEAALTAIGVLTEAKKPL